MSKPGAIKPMLCSGAGSPRRPIDPHLIIYKTHNVVRDVRKLAATFQPMILYTV